MVRVLCSILFYLWLFSFNFSRPKHNLVRFTINFSSRDCVARRHKSITILSLSLSLSLSSGFHLVLSLYCPGTILLSKQQTHTHTCEIHYLYVSKECFNSNKCVTIVHSSFLPPISFVRFFFIHFYHEFVFLFSLLTLALSPLLSPFELLYFSRFLHTWPSLLRSSFFYSPLPSVRRRFDIFMVDYCLFTVCQPETSAFSNNLSFSLSLSLSKINSFSRQQQRRKFVSKPFPRRRKEAKKLKVFVL